jgi:protein-L-isoaspartate(D-aspartate) O-methyltransferase
MTANDEELKGAREDMVRLIEATARNLAPQIGRDAFSRRVIDAMRETPRHLFVPREHLHAAYLNRPVPIGHGQTISQPLIVALMSDLIEPRSGYQTAILSRLVAKVFTIEICRPLAERAARTFRELGLANIEARSGDGYLGWPEEAPFDAILVAAAPAEIPPELVRQLKPGGRLVLPVGGPQQQLIVVEKQSDQSTVLRDIIPVCFVPLTRQGSPPEI